MARLRDVSKLAAFNTWLGIELVRAEPGEIELRLRRRPEFGQYNGYMHAAIVGGLIDTACGFAAATMVGNVLAEPQRRRVEIIRGCVVRRRGAHLGIVTHFTNSGGDCGTFSTRRRVIPAA